MKSEKAGGLRFLELCTQELEVQGITITNPPFHSFTVYGTLNKAGLVYSPSAW